MKVILIAAIGARNELGKNNQLLWHLPNDLKRFKKLTSGHCIIMGRKTYDSLGKPLPNRTNIVISRSSHKNEEGLVYVHNLKQAFIKARELGEQDCFVIGGAQIFIQALPYADILEITHVHHNFDADVFFPDVDFSKWLLLLNEDYSSDEKNKFNYSYATYQTKELRSKALFLDRDGVLNKEINDYITTLQDLEIDKNIIPLLQEKQKEGYKLIVITNQGAIEKGRLTHESLRQINDELARRFMEYGVAFDEIYYCPHHSDISNCLCRKPKSIMIEKALARFNINPNESYMIGDKERDKYCAEAAAVLGILIESNQPETISILNK